MKVEYRNRSIEKVCTIASVAERSYGRQMADKIQLRIDQIKAADPLHQNRKNQYAVDLVHPMRLVFEKKGNEIQIANIIEITDYHR